VIFNHSRAYATPRDNARPSTSQVLEVKGHFNPDRLVVREHRWHCANMHQVWFKIYLFFTPHGASCKKGLIGLIYLLFCIMNNAIEHLRIPKVSKPDWQGHVPFSMPFERISVWIGKKTKTSSNYNDYLTVSSSQFHSNKCIGLIKRKANDKLDICSL
jgi:hypothetical protein